MRLPFVIMQQNNDENAFEIFQALKEADECRVFINEDYIPGDNPYGDEYPGPTAYVFEWNCWKSFDEDLISDVLYCLDTQKFKLVVIGEDGYSEEYGSYSGKMMIGKSIIIGYFGVEKDDPEVLLKDGKDIIENLCKGENINGTKEN